MKKLWNWLKGKKTNIGMVIMLVAQGVQVFAPNVLPANQIDYIQMLGGLIGGVGLAHKGVKTSMVKNIVSSLTKPKKK